MKVFVLFSEVCIVLRMLFVFNILCCLFLHQFLHTAHFDD